jgi:hypothetical protein
MESPEVSTPTGRSIPFGKFNRKPDVTVGGCLAEPDEENCQESDSTSQKVLLVIRPYLNLQYRA